MSILSVSFLLFVLGLCTVYFLAPKRFQWWVLLIFSLAFYALGGLLNLPSPTPPVMPFSEAQSTAL